MGEYVFPDWIRSGYTVTTVNPLHPWFGPLAGEMTVTMPFDIVCDPAFASGPDEFVYNRLVENTSAGDVHMGFVARVKSNLHELEWFTQVWVDGVRQIDETQPQSRPNFLNAFTIGSSPIVPIATADLWVATCGYSAVPW